MRSHAGHLEVSSTSKDVEMELSPGTVYFRKFYPTQPAGILWTPWPLCIPIRPRFAKFFFLYTKQYRQKGCVNISLSSGYLLPTI